MKSYILLTEAKSDGHIMPIWLGADNEEDAINRIRRLDSKADYYYNFIGVCEDPANDIFILIVNCACIILPIIAVLALILLCL